MRSTLLVLTAFAGALAPATAAAEVVSAAETGFVTQSSATVSATPDEVWTVLVRPSRYWNPEHTWYGRADQLFITFGPGGCFCEIVNARPEDTLEDQVFVEHARVIFTDPGRLLRLSGAFGPMQGEALTGTLSVELAAADGGGTTVTWTYVVGGHARFSLPELAPVVDMVMTEQLMRMAQAVESSAETASAGE